MPKSLDPESSDGFPEEGDEMEDGVKIGDFRVYLGKINVRISAREQGVLYRYFEKQFFKNRALTDEEVFPMIKKFLLHTSAKRNVDVIRKECMRTANLWTLDKLCGIEIEGDQLPMDSAVRQELDRLQRCAARLPTDVNEKDTRKRDHMFQKYDIGKTGRLVLAAVDNMIHLLFGDLAYDVKNVVRAAFRATKNVAMDSGECDPKSMNQIEREEFRLLLLALKAHIELFIAFRMVDSSRDMKIDFEEFKKALPMLKRWGVDTSDPHALFEIIDADHSGEITFTEFVNWSLKEAIISDLEYRERISHHVEVGDTVLLTGEKYRGMIAKVVGYDRTSKKYVLELPDGTRINRKHTEFVNGAGSEEVLPKVKPGTNSYSRWFQSLLTDIMPGTDHPWITETPIYIKSQWSTRETEYLFEIRCKFGEDGLKTSSWAKSFKEAQNFAAKSMREKIEVHPDVLKALQYVNLEVAKTKEAESKRMRSLKSDQSAEQSNMEEYRMQLWKREMTGVPTVDPEGFFNVLQDCGAKCAQRDARQIHRYCSKGHLEADFYDLHDFFENAKHLDRKLQSIREKIQGSWKKKKWVGFVERSNPDDREENLRIWDEEHERPEENAAPGVADGLDYEEFHAAAENPPEIDEEEVKSRNEEEEELMAKQKATLRSLEAFVDSDAEDEVKETPKSPPPQVKVKNKKKGGLLVVKKRGMSKASVDEKKKTNIVRSRPGDGKRKG